MLLVTTMSLQVVLTLNPDNQLTAALRRRDGREVPVKPPGSWRPLIERWAFGRTPAVQITAAARVMARLNMFWGLLGPVGSGVGTG